jgi:stearoyl-CoA desaturase (delta-9 desaturase)
MAPSSVPAASALRQTTGTRPAAFKRDGTYDGDRPFAEAAPGARYPWLSAPALITLALVVAPLVGVVAAVVVSVKHGVGLFPLVLAGVLYTVTGLGITLGYHRGITHRSYQAKSWLRVGLATAGSMAFQGSVATWTATHRQHHAFTDEPGDPHSPYRYGTSARAQLHGLVESHLAWLWRDEAAPVERFAPDVRADRGLRAVDAAFPYLCVLSLALPFVAGLLWTGTVGGGFVTLLWAGLVRVALLQHVTWSINSLCHVAGQRPYATRRFDRAGDVWALSLLSFGESWHNGHHADPSCARHGRGPHQVDISATVLRGMERLGWVSNVHWPQGPPPPRPDHGAFSSRGSRQAH